MRIFKIAKEESYFQSLIRLMEAKGYVCHLPYFNREKCLSWPNGDSFPTFASQSGEVKAAVSMDSLHMSRNYDVNIHSRYGDEKHLMIAGVVVSPESRGKGLASKIVDDLMACGREIGVTFELEASPMKSYNDKKNKGLTEKQLQEWYKKKGFKPKYPDAKYQKDKILTTHEQTRNWPVDE